MTMFDDIKKGIADLPISDILKAQIVFLGDRLAEAEKQITALQLENARLNVALEQERREHEQTKADYQRLKDEHVEEIRIFDCVEFRRGKRTGAKWMAFCPVCHLPAHETEMNAEPVVACPGPKCGWALRITENITSMAGKLP